MRARNRLAMLCGLCLVTAVGGLSLVTASAQPRTPTPKTKIELEMVTVLPPNREKMKIWLTTVDRINKLAAQKYPGEFSIKILGGPEVIPAIQQPIALRKGHVDMISTFGSMVESTIPALNTLILSQITPDEERARGAIAYLRTLAAEVGFFFLGLDDASKDPIFYLSSTRPVKSLADLKGRRAGGLGTLGQASAEAFGMSFKIMPYGETFTAMERGVIDVYINAPDTLAALGIDQIKRVTVIDHAYYIGAPLSLMNLKKWNSLPQHLRDLMEQARIETEPETARLMIGFYQRARQKMIDAGVQFIRLSPADAERFVDLAYSSQWDKVTHLQPEAIAKLRQMLSK